MLGPQEATSNFGELRGLFVDTHKVFHAFWDRGGELRSEEVQFLATVTLSHIDDIDTGFRWTLRTSELPRAELGHVLDAGDTVDWDEEPGGASREPLAPDLRKVMALRHAQVVFGYLPRTPQGEVSYPGYSSYGDIGVPRSPLELRERIRELASGVWDAATGRPVSTLDPERARRVYGFWEAGSYLTRSHARRMRRN